MSVPESQANIQSQPRRRTDWMAVAQKFVQQEMPGLEYLLGDFGKYRRRGAFCVDGRAVEQDGLRSRIYHFLDREGLLPNRSKVYEFFGALRDLCYRDEGMR